MADVKISALPAATTPLAGTEVLPIVQSGVTDKVSVANLTAGRAISATELTLTAGNLVIGTSGKGITTGSTIPLELGTNNGVSSAIIHNSGGVSIGNSTDPGATNLSVNGKIMSGTATSAGQATISCNGATTGALAFVDTNTGGKTWAFGPGVATGSATLYSFYNATDANLTGYFTSAGAWYQGNNSSSWSTTSDERVKENIVDLQNGLSVILGLQPKEFDYKETGKHDVSFIAQEYQQVLPEQVTYTEPTNNQKQWIDDNKLLGLNKNLDPYFVKAIQEIVAKLKAADIEGF